MAGLVPAIYVFVRRAPQDVDARDERGHDNIRRHRAPGRLTRRERERERERETECTGGRCSVRPSRSRRLFVWYPARRRVSGRSPAIHRASRSSRAGRLSAESSVTACGVAGAPTGSVRNARHCRQVRCRVNGRPASRCPVRRCGRADCADLGRKVTLPKISSAKIAEQIRLH
jgi:hypothetical protein